MKVRITFTEPLLGTASNNPDLHRDYVASKSPDAASIEEEVAAIGVDGTIDKSITVFPREDGKPFLWDYQIKGFIKEATSILVELADKEIKVGKTKLTKWTSKRVIDNYVFVTPRKAMINGTQIENKVRPLRAMTMQGERVALAESEQIGAGATVEFEIRMLADNLRDTIVQALDYGALKGLGQWRNGGFGKFTYQIVE